MFTFAVQRDTLRIAPRDFGKDSAQAIKEEIHRRYANKILPGVGLVLCLLDLLDASEGAVLYGDGCLYYKADFRLVVFRPHLQDVFVARVQSSSEAGIRLTVGFFDDILVPSHLLPEHTIFDPSRQAFFWVSDEDSIPPAAEGSTRSPMFSTAQEARLYIEKGDWVRAIVESEQWDEGGSGPPAVQGKEGAAATGRAAEGTGAKGEEKAVYSITGSMSESGTGCLHWWEQDDEEEDAMET